jgi:hypothetical protein
MSGVVGSMQAVITAMQNPEGHRLKQTKESYAIEIRHFCNVICIVVSGAFACPTCRCL